MLIIASSLALIFKLVFSSLLYFSAFSKTLHPHLPNDAHALLDFTEKADLHKNKLILNTSISHCKWQGVECFKHNTRIFRLVIEDVNLGGTFEPKTLTRLDQLRVLSLRNTSLEGHIPNLSGLVNLKVLFLNHNHFSGFFPASIIMLQRLKTVDLSYNLLSGDLPTWLTRIPRVYYLRLEFNRFSGAIPPMNQSTLSIFNVSNNDLNGPIPLTQVLANFKASSFSDNPGLCGEILHKECNKTRFFRGGWAPEPVDAPQPTEGVRGVPTTRRRTMNKLFIWGFTVGVLFLVSSVACFGVALRKSRRGEQIRIRKLSSSEQNSSSAEYAAAAVMRTEEEREQKVKSAQQEVGILKKNKVEEIGKSGNLVFCAGETELYSVEQLMRGSAELLGRGTLGTTYKAVLDNRLIVCVKRIDATKIAAAGKHLFQRHMESVGALRHPNLVPLRCYFQAQDERLLVYDYQPNGSLFSLIHGSKSARAKPLHWTSCLKIAEDVAQGLSYIHQAWRLVHGNLKSSNVLLGSDFEACITDYCLSVLTDQSSLLADNDHSLWAYKAPEIRKSDSEATSKSDVYAFGVLLLELLTGKPPSQHPFLTPNDIVHWVRSARDVADGGADESRLVMLLEVAIACSVASPEQRPNMWQVLKMLQEIREAALMDDDTELPLAEGIS
ncbi:hypothetical protein RDABS01_010451 [Bienertia sinuspersici]